MRVLIVSDHKLPILPWYVHDVAGGQNVERLPVFAVIIWMCLSVGPAAQNAQHEARTGHGVHSRCRWQRTVPAQCKAAAAIARDRSLWRTHGGHDQIANAKNRPGVACSLLLLLEDFLVAGGRTGQARTKSFVEISV
jgi:hypothetical protein